MPAIMRILITLAAAGAVGFVCRKIGVPGGMMLGGIVGAALLNLLTDNAYAPFFIRFFAQSVAGGFLGAAIDKDKLRQFPRLALPLAVIVTGLLITDFVMGALMVLVSPMDLVTALCSGIPGGINDVPLIAADMGADAGKVAVLQFVRLITGIMLIPMLIRLMDKSAVQTAETADKGLQKKRKISRRETAVGLLAAMGGGYIGRLIGLPGGVLLFSMIAVAVLYLTTGYGAIEPSTKQIAQLFSGAYIGSLLHRQDILELRYLILPALIVVVMFAVSCVVFSFFLRKITAMDVKQSMLACSPAGASEMALMSSELNIVGDFAADIMLLHVFRVIVVVSLFPQIISLVVKFF